MKKNTPVNDAEKQYLLVDRSILPDVYGKVVEAKRLLVSGRVKNLSEAAKAAGISRSALYKYKDYVFMYHARLEDNVITLFATLEDLPGVLSSLINFLSDHGANVLTINQNIPVDGVAPVSLSVRLSSGYVLAELLAEMTKLDGVVSARVLNSL